MLLVRHIHLTVILDTPALCHRYHFCSTAAFIYAYSACSDTTTVCYHTSDVGHRSVTLNSNTLNRVLNEAIVHYRLPFFNSTYNAIWILHLTVQFGLAILYATFIDINVTAITVHYSTSTLQWRGNVVRFGTRFSCSYKLTAILL